MDSNEVLQQLGTQQWQPDSLFRVEGIDPNSPPNSGLKLASTRGLSFTSNQVIRFDVDPIQCPVIFPQMDVKFNVPKNQLSIIGYHTLLHPFHGAGALFSKVEIFAGYGQEMCIETQREYNRLNGNVEAYTQPVGTRASENGPGLYTDGSYELNDMFTYNKQHVGPWPCSKDQSSKDPLPWVTFDPARWSIPAYANSQAYDRTNQPDGNLDLKDDYVELVVPLKLGITTQRCAIPVVAWGGLRVEITLGDFANAFVPALPCPFYPAFNGRMNNIANGGDAAAQSKIVMQNPAGTQTQTTFDNTLWGKAGWVPGMPVEVFSTDDDGGGHLTQVVTNTWIRSITTAAANTANKPLQFIVGNAADDDTPIGTTGHANTQITMRPHNNPDQNIDAKFQQSVSGVILDPILVIARCQFSPKQMGIIQKSGGTFKFIANGVSFFKMNSTGLTEIENPVPYKQLVSTLMIPTPTYRSPFFMPLAGYFCPHFVEYQFIVNNVSQPNLPIPMTGLMNAGNPVVFNELDKALEAAGRPVLTFENFYMAAMIGRAYTAFGGSQALVNNVRVQIKLKDDAPNVYDYRLWAFNFYVKTVTYGDGKVNIDF